MNALRKYIEQQNTLAVAAVLVRGLGNAAPKIDHSCVIVPNVQPGKRAPEPEPKRKGAGK